jgi:hypothetical protein
MSSCTFAIHHYRTLATTACCVCFPEIVILDLVCYVPRAWRMDGARLTREILLALWLPHAESRVLWDPVVMTSRPPGLCDFV